MSDVRYGRVSWERMIRAVEKVCERVLRAASALEAANVPYAVAGGNAVAAWVSRVDESAVRNTQDVDVLLRRSDLDAAKAAMSTAGFVHACSPGVDMFLDGPDGRPKDAVHVVFAGEKVRPDYAAVAPDVSASEQAVSFSVVALDALVQMELSSFRSKNRMHVLDLIDVGLVDAGWCDRLPEALAARLLELLADPEG